MVEVTAAAVHQASNQGFSRWPGAGQRTAKGTGTVIEIDGFVTVIFNQPLHVVGNGVKSFFPADALEFTFATFTDPLHRVLQTIGIIDTTAHGTTAQTGANLMQAVVVIITGIIRFDVFNLAIDNMHAQRAAASTVNRTRTPGYALCRRTRRNRLGSIHDAAEGKRKRTAGHRQSANGRGFHQTTAADLGCQ